MKKEFFPLKYKVKLIGPSGHFETEAPADTCAQSTIIGAEISKIIGLKQDKMSAVEMVSLGSRFFAYKAKIRILAEGRKICLKVVTAKDIIDPNLVLLGTDFLKKIDFLQHHLKDFSHLYGLIKQSKHKCVLIIGPDKKEDHLESLYRIKGRLKEFGYEGILLRDYPDIEEQSIEEKMNLFGNIAKFVICENSYPSGHIDELNICARNRLVTIILQDNAIRSGATWMQACYPIDFTFIKKIFYRHAALLPAIGRAVNMAESVVNKRRNALNREYKYRQEWLNESIKKD
ncbi:MAG: hypothetical protein PHN49_01290 [Candidatus Omnitrophica bacterium]|nr:hypothetical protein [Candidatus Portnoybacteria bacterium]MDD5670251.1 hypothetical protein [Candidatus Omnitrophota bacterium]